MWAATVQHGPARAGDFCMALRDESETLDDMALVERIYALRHAAIDRDFGDQDPLIRRLLRVRYDLEKKDAFKILEEIDHQS
jgi:hypothetical protein